jgi:hypothetical protein
LRAALSSAAAPPATIAIVSAPINPRYRIGLSSEASP